MVFFFYLCGMLSLRIKLKPKYKLGTSINGAPWRLIALTLSLFLIDQKANFSRKPPFTLKFGIKQVDKDQISTVKR